MKGFRELKKKKQVTVNPGLVRVPEASKSGDVRVEVAVVQTLYRQNGDTYENTHITSVKDLRNQLEEKQSEVADLEALLKEAEAAHEKAIKSYKSKEKKQRRR